MSKIVFKFFKTLGIFKRNFIKVFTVLVRGFILFIIFIILLAGFLVLFFESNIWAYYPGSMRAEAALQRLHFSCLIRPYGGMCDLRCAYERNFYQKVLGKYLAEHHPLMMRKIRHFIFDKKHSSCFKGELIGVLKSYVNQKRLETNVQTVKAPTFLIDYLKSPDKDLEVEEEIVKHFATDVNQKEVLDILIKEALNKKTECFYREKAIDYLASYLKDDSFPILKRIIEENQADEENQWAAIYAARYFFPVEENRQIIDWIERYMLNEDSVSNTYVAEFFSSVLNYYAERFPQEKDYIMNILGKIYRKESLSLILRDRVAAAANHLAGKEVYQPLLSENDPMILDHNLIIILPPYPDWCRPRTDFH